MPGFFGLSVYVIFLRDMIIVEALQTGEKRFEELINLFYPLPIAIAYRRMMRAYHNPYEQVNRLVELYELPRYSSST